MNPGQADTLGTMRATGWTKGQTHEPGGYGLKITAEDRDRHFDRAWGDIDVDLEGQGSRRSRSPNPSGGALSCAPRTSAGGYSTAVALHGRRANRQ